MSECIHELQFDECSACKERYGPRPRPPLPKAYTFISKYESQCHGCNLPVYPGQQVVRAPDGPTVHLSCASEGWDR